MRSSPLKAILFLLLPLLGCGDQVVGWPAADDTAPTVIAAAPAASAVDVPRNTAVAATFSEELDRTTVSASTFTLSAGAALVSGSVTYAGVTAIFTPDALLADDTEYTATVTTGATDLAGNAMITDHVWTFTTGALVDATAPIVVATTPLDEATDVMRSTPVTATFSEMMGPATLSDATFTLMDGVDVVTGVVTYVGLSAIFAPDEDLAYDTEYTATVTAGVTDLAGNAMFTDHVWTFTTGPDLGPVVTESAPQDLAIQVPTQTEVEATFSAAMDPLTLSESSFIVTGPGGLEVLGTVSYDELTMTVTFTPDEDLLEATTYVAEITTEAADLAGTSLEMSYLWSFTTVGWPIGGFAPVDLGSLSGFVAIAGAGLTNSNSGGVTTLNGDVGLHPTATCLGDGEPCTLLNPVINGTLFAADPEGIASQAKTDLTAAYVDAMARPVGTTVNDITGMVLQPGVYTSASTMSVAVGGVVTLDGMGDANAVWIFQIGSSLTVNNDAQVLLVNGAQAKNVFWAVFGSSTLGSNVQFVGSVLAGASNSVGTGSVVIGRLLCTEGQITLLSNTITLPAP